GSRARQRTRVEKRGALPAGCLPRRIGCGSSSALRNPLALRTFLRTSISTLRRLTSNCTSHEASAAGRLTPRVHRHVSLLRTARSTRYESPGSPCLLGPTGSRAPAHVHDELRDCRDAWPDARAARPRLSTGVPAPAPN